MPYTTIQDVRDRLRIDEAFAEDDLERMILEAEDIIADYLELSEPYTSETVPYRVRTATLLVIQALYDSSDDPLTVAVRSVLHRTRRPVLA